MGIGTMRASEIGILGLLLVLLILPTGFFAFPDKMSIIAHSYVDPMAWIIAGFLPVGVLLAHRRSLNRSKFLFATGALMLVANRALLVTMDPIRFEAGILGIQTSDYVYVSMYGDVLRLLFGIGFLITGTSGLLSQHRGLRRWFHQRTNRDGSAGVPPLTR